MLITGDGSRSRNAGHRKTGRWMREGAEDPHSQRRCPQGSQSSASYAACSPSGEISAVKVTTGAAASVDSGKRMKAEKEDRVVENEIESCD